MKIFLILGLICSIYNTIPAATVQQQSPSKVNPPPPPLPVASQNVKPIVSNQPIKGQPAPAAVPQPIKPAIPVVSQPNKPTTAPIIKNNNKNNVEFPLAENCDPIKCNSPTCRCSATQLSHNIPIEKIPQLVMTTFDDAITALNYEYIQEAIRPLKNPDNCPAQATFFVSHEYTDYVKVHQLYNQGHEIALHSISHTPLTTYWNNATVELLINEFGDQRDLMSHFAQINKTDLVGMRLPLFELSGNNSYIAMKKIGLLYDSSWPTQHFIQPGIWPYTLDYKSQQDCPIGKCPTASIPNIWISPLLNWYEPKTDNKCAMLDACINLPTDTLDDIFNWMVMNFNQTYYGNRAPFGIYLHASWFLKGDNFFPAYKKFLKYLNGLPDVYIVSMARVIEYVRNPRPGKPFDSCVKRQIKQCKERFCQLKRIDNGEERWMKSCVPCPAVYPWVNNPLGKAPKKLQ